ncbi:XRE family transcriptional regulator [Mycobacterium eburneum]|nr:helix-turn-helix transcriptional regulator [Mycobacterium eburneum]TDH48715.1 XRE family transcriptional regulator [Mycobacterium eburneum]
MHEYRRFIQQQLDDRGWRRADLAHKSGLSRQLISQILTDKREHLGQMPDDRTMERLAKGFGVPVEIVRTAAARSLVGYQDDGVSLTVPLQGVSTDALLNEIRRRIDDAESRAAASAATESDAPAEVDEVEEGDEEPARPDSVHHPPESLPHDAQLRSAWDGWAYTLRSGARRDQRGDDRHQLRR